MKGFKYMKTGHGVSGEVQIVSGTAMISNGRMWLSYPDTAHELIKLAQDHGWGFDDGLPGKGRRRLNSDGVPFIRILIGREKGENACDPEAVSPGIQFHITWRMPHPIREPGKRSWILGEMYVKTSDTEGWQRVTTISAVRGLIEQEPVQVPNGYATV